MLNFYFKDSIESFLNKSVEEIIGTITISNPFDSKLFQNKSWELQIPVLKNALADYSGTIFFEFLYGEFQSCQTDHRKADLTVLEAIGNSQIKGSFFA